MSLTYKQRAFVEAFTDPRNPQAYLNATRAAEAAGYSPSKRSLRNIGYENMTKPHIRDAVHRALLDRGARPDILVFNWLRRSTADLSDFMTAHGLDVEAVKRAGLGFMLKGVRVTRDGVTFELRDPDKAEDMLARHLGMFVDRHEHSGQTEIVIRSVGGGVVEEL